MSKLKIVFNLKVVILYYFYEVLGVLHKEVGIANLRAQNLMEIFC
jgi:hypothetical protein